MGKKFAVSTKIFFFICLGSIICFFMGEFLWLDIITFIALITLPISFTLTIILAVRDKAKIQYTGVTKFFFVAFMLCVGMVVYGILDFIFIWPYISFYFLGIGFYGGMLLGIILLILGLRDRSRPKQRGAVQPYIPPKPVSIVELKKFLSISSRITIHDAANALQTDRAQLLKFIAEHKNELPVMHIDGEYILLLADNKPWICQVCGFENYGSKTNCEECKSPYTN